MLLTIILSALLIGLDQFFKYLAVQMLAPNGTVTIIPGVLGLRYLENTGAAFSVLWGKQLFLIIITGIALLALFVFLLFRRPQSKLAYTALLLLFAGGMGNFIDRVVNRYVVDFLEFLFMNFAVFNFADICIVAGFCLCVIAIVKSEVDARKLVKQAGASVSENSVDKSVNTVIVETEETANEAVNTKLSQNNVANSDKDAQNDTDG